MIRRGDQQLGAVNYTVHLISESGQATVVELEPKPDAKDGELLHLTLDDGRVLNCQMLDASPYCAVVGDGPVRERRSRVRK